MSKSIIQDKLNRQIHDLRISVIDRCNFRCTYCMPEEEYNKHYTFLQKDKWLTFDEIVRLTKIFIQLGVDKVRITGGEPLLRPEIETLISKLSEISGIKDLALTTNGSHLKDKALALKQAGLQRLTVSLDTLDEDVFKKMSGQKGDVKQVLEGIKEAERAGFDAIKINVVVQKGVNEHTVIDMVDYFRRTNHILRFIEYMDVGNCNGWEMKHVVPTKELIERISQKFVLKSMSPNYYGEVAARFKFDDGPGEIGFITSVTQPFCSSCTRARLSTDGQIYTCLFAQNGQDIKTALRNDASDEELTKIISCIWQNRQDRYSELRQEIHRKHQEMHKVEMFQIGG